MQRLGAAVGCGGVWGYMTEACLQEPEGSLSCQNGEFAGGSPRQAHKGKRTCLDTMEDEVLLQEHGSSCTSPPTRSSPSAPPRRAGAVGRAAEAQLGGRLLCRQAVEAELPPVAVDEVFTKGTPVILHVYDVHGVRGVRLVNALFRPIGAGAFHAGVEVYKKEWSFGWSSRRGSGVFSCSPRRNPLHRYRESVSLGRTPLSQDEVAHVVAALKKNWPGRDYDLVLHNCCDFAGAFAAALKVDPIPAWVNSLAGRGGELLHRWHSVQDLVGSAIGTLPMAFEALQAEHAERRGDGEEPRQAQAVASGAERTHLTSL